MKINFVASIETDETNVKIDMIWPVVAAFLNQGFDSWDLWIYDGFERMIEDPVYFTFGRC